MFYITTFVYIFVNILKSNSLSYFGVKVKEIMHLPVYYFLWHDTTIYSGMLL